MFSLLVTFNLSALTTPSTVTLSVTFTSLNEPLAVAVTLPVIPKVEPLNVRLAESSISPPPPTITTLSFVKSVTVRDAILASSVTIKSAKEADAEPLILPFRFVVPVTLSIEPSKPKLFDESNPCVPVNIAILLFAPLPLMIESPFSNNILCSKSFWPAIQLSFVVSQSNEPEVAVPSASPT